MEIATDIDKFIIQLLDVQDYGNSNNKKEVCTSTIGTRSADTDALISTTVIQFEQL